MKKQHPNEEDGVKNPFKCPHSPQTTFSTARKLNNHVKSKHPSHSTPKPTISRAKHRKPTEKITKIRRDFECNDCQATFVCQRSLRIHTNLHKRTHDAEKKIEENDGLTLLESGSYLENGELRTAEMLASLAEQMRYGDVVSGFFAASDTPEFVESDLL